MLLPLKLLHKGVWLYTLLSLTYIKVFVKNVISVMLGETNMHQK